MKAAIIFPLRGKDGAIFELHLEFGWQTLRK